MMSVESENADITVVVVDATKLNKLARFCYRNTGEIIKYFKKLKATGKLLVATEITVNRAWQSFKRKTSFQNENEEQKIKKLYYGKVKTLLDKIVSPQSYQEFIPDADQILQDTDWQKEDAHVLACAIAYSYLDLRTFIWTDDSDFLSKAQLIESRFGIRVFPLA